MGLATLLGPGSTGLTVIQAVSLRKLGFSEPSADSDCFAALGVAGIKA